MPEEQRSWSRRQVELDSLARFRRDNVRRLHASIAGLGDDEIVVIYVADPNDSTVYRITVGELFKKLNVVVECGGINQAAPLCIQCDNHMMLDLDQDGGEFNSSSYMAIETSRTAENKLAVDQPHRQFADLKNLGVPRELLQVYSAQQLVQFGKIVADYLPLTVSTDPDDSNGSVVQ